MALLVERRSEIEAHGASLVFVGHGEAWIAKAFAEERGLDVPLYTDPHRAAYKAIGFRKGATLGQTPRIARATFRALAGGFRQTKTVGNPAQNGGVLVVGSDGVTRWSFHSEAAGDHPSIESILAAVDGAAAGP